MTAGFINRKTDYVVIGTASNVQIQYDSAIDNLNELELVVSVKDPIINCFKDQVVEVKMVDDKMERAIPLSTMIDIHHFIISKLDTNELSEGIKQKIVEEYEKEEYHEVKNIINDLDVSLDDPKRQIEILTTEIMRLKEIEAEARLYSRVHTKSYNRCLSENKKMVEKIGRKSMLSHQEYVVHENNIRFDEQYNQIVDCYCCGTAIDIKDAHRSHIVARELGGSCDKNNIRICCKKCNLGMSMMDLEEYKVSLQYL
jgi:5-methylcytosine-specific restriction endonuclease McrA